MKEINITLPWPPSANTYWRRNGNCYFISPKGMEYRSQVIKICKELSGLFLKTDRIRLDILACPPDRRKRDLDNILKALIDSLQHASIYNDDNQIDIIRIERAALIGVGEPPINAGKVYIKLRAIDV